jgi:hypothetical protein
MSALLRRSWGNRTSASRTRFEVIYSMLPCRCDGNHEMSLGRECLTSLTVRRVASILRILPRPGLNSILGERLDNGPNCLLRSACDLARFDNVTV